MNCSYYFFPGSNIDLSKAEIEAVTGDTPVSVAGLFQTSKPIKFPQQFLDRLGGSPELVKCIKNNIPKESLFSVLYENLAQKQQKIFSVNMMPPCDAELLKLLLRLKRDLKSHQIRSRFLNMRGNVNRIAAFKERLHITGTNLWVIKENAGNYSIGETAAFQNIETYKLRDYEKPYRDARAGMIPPKLAQIMINLAIGANAEKRAIVDPFCGSGTVAIEALLMGYEARGSDINAESIQGSQKNHEWLQARLKMDHRPVFEVRDATKLTPEDITSNCAIVSELDLGPPLSRFPDPQLLQRIKARLKPFYESFLNRISEIGRANTPLSLAFPIWFCPKSASMFDSIDLPPKFQLLKRFIYRREDQIVGREIICLRLN